jgi:hypothetical protein
MVRVLYEEPLMSPSSIPYSRGQACVVRSSRQMHSASESNSASRARLGVTPRAPRRSKAWSWWRRAPPSTKPRCTMHGGRRRCAAAQAYAQPRRSCPYPSPGCGASMGVRAVYHSDCNQYGNLWAPSTSDSTPGTCNIVFDV